MQQDWFRVDLDGYPKQKGRWVTYGDAKHNGAGRRMDYWNGKEFVSLDHGINRKGVTHYTYPPDTPTEVDWNYEHAPYSQGESKVVIDNLLGKQAFVRSISKTNNGYNGDYEHHFMEITHVSANTVMNKGKTTYLLFSENFCIGEFFSQDVVDLIHFGKVEINICGFKSGKYTQVFIENQT